ncbi:MAG: hypothetical protein DRN14_04290 [Thermoplasmata archaeon]|nr:MAG: hypothetical protein DRN14_04290 [Thermoplasmata archaeon]
MRGGVSAPVLAIVSFAVMIVVSTAIVGFIFYQTGVSEMPLQLVGGMGLLYSRASELHGVLNLNVVGGTEVRAISITVWGEREVHSAHLDVTLEPGGTRVLSFSIPGATWDFIKGLLYSFRLQTDYGYLNGKALYIGSPTQEYGKVEWPQTMHDAWNSNVYQGQVPDTLSVAQQSILGEYGWVSAISPAAAGYGYLWLGIESSTGKYLLRIDPYTLSVDVAVPDAGSSHFSPLAADGLIYSACDSTIYGIDPFSGNVVWTVAMAGGKVLSGAFYDDYLYVPVAYGDSGQLLRIDPLNGRLLDYVDLPAPPINFLTVEGGLGYLALDAGNGNSTVVAIDLAGMDIKWVRGPLKGRVLEYPIPVGSGLLYILADVGGYGRIYLLDAEDGESPLPWWIYNLTIWDTRPWKTTNGLVQQSDLLVGAYVNFHGVDIFGCADLHIDHYDGERFSGTATAVAHQYFSYFGINGIGGSSGLVFFTGYDYARFTYLFMLTKDQFLDPYVTIDDVIHVGIPIGTYPWAPLAYDYALYAFGINVYYELVIVRAGP